MRSSEKPGLRERKKARTRAAIQDAALRLYLRQGYHETTVEQIAEAADVSPATFFRYFPTKPETVLFDRLDPFFMDAFVQQPAELSQVAALRAAMRDIFESLEPEAQTLEEARMRLVAEVPELRAAWAQRVEADSRMVTEAVARRTGREPDEFEVIVFVGALLGGVIAAFVSAADEPDGGMPAKLDRAFDYMEDHLFLDPGKP